MNDRWLSAHLLDQVRWHLPVGRRQCRDHPGRWAQDRCDRCGQPFCAACLVHFQRWRLCRPCHDRLGREWRAQTLRRRLWRVRGELVAALVILLVFVGSAAVVQHLLGNAGSDASLAHAALQLSGGGSSQPTKTATVPPPAPALALVDLHAIAQYHGSAAVRTGVRGRRFQPGETVRILVTWRGSGHGGPVVSRSVGPLSAKADTAGSFLVQADLGDRLPALPNAALDVTAMGSAGGHAHLTVVLGHE